MNNTNSASSQTDFRFCPYCGRTLSADFAYCPSCGRKIPRAPEPQPPKPQPPQPQPPVVDKPVSPDDWKCGREKLLEMSRAVFPENGDRVEEFCAMMELLMDGAVNIGQKSRNVDWGAENARYRCVLSPHQIVLCWEISQWREDCYDGGCGGNLESWVDYYTRTMSEIDRAEYEKVRSEPNRIRAVRTEGQGECLEMPYHRSERVTHYYRDYKGLKGYYQCSESVLSSDPE